MKKFEIVEVRWIDCRCETGWVPARDFIDLDDNIVISFGLLVQEREHQITVSAFCDTQEETWADSHTIPKVVIKSRKSHGFLEIEEL